MVSNRSNRNQRPVRPHGVAARAAAQRAGAATPAVLRHTADVLKRDVDTATLIFGHVTAERLELLAEELERVLKAEPASAVLVELQQRLQQAATGGSGLVLFSHEVRRYRTALEREAADTVRRLAASGLAAAVAQGEATQWMQDCLDARGAAARATELAERAKHIAQREHERTARVHDAVRRLIAEIDMADETAGPELVFEFSNEPHPDGMSVEDAMELAHQVESAVGADDATGTSR